jgi:glycosyltransferase involved in cell wall biosynthesis
MTKTRKTIVHAIRQGKIGGGESHVLSLVSRLNRELYRNVVICFTHGPMIDALKDLDIDYHVIPTTIPFNVTIVNELTSILKLEKADLIHAHGTRAASNVFMGAARLDIPWVYTIHGWSFHSDQNAFISFIRKTSERWLTLKASKNICVSYANENLGKKLIELKNSTVIHNGVDFIRFNPTINFRKTIREENGITEEAYCVAFIVRMTKQKDPLNTIRAISLSLNQNRALHFLIAGDGELLEPSKRLATELKVDKHISFLGFRTDVPELLSACDAFILPSLWEGLPIGIIEAMAMKKTIIVSDIEANAELISHEKEGILIPRENPEALSQALIEVSTNENSSKEMAEAAYQKSQALFNLDNMAIRVGHIYQSILHH